MSLRFFQSGSMLTMTHSTSQHRSPQESPTHLPDQDLLGITNGVDAFSFDGDCEDDDITEPIAPCTSLSPTINRENGKSDMFDIRSIQSLEDANLAEIKTSDIPAGIECATHVENQKSPTQEERALSAHKLTDSLDHFESIIDDSGSTLDDFIVYVRNKTRNGLFDEYQAIKSQPPDGTFDHARLSENLAKVS